MKWYNNAICELTTHQNARLVKTAKRRTPRFNLEIFPINDKLPPYHSSEGLGDESITTNRGFIIDTDEFSDIRVENQMRTTQSRTKYDEYFSEIPRGIFRIKFYF